MAKKPTIRATWLGQELRSLRDQAGLSTRAAGRYLYRDASTISRMEVGEMYLSAEMLNAFLDMCGLEDPHKRADLEFIRRDVGRTGWWDGYRGEIAAGLMDRAWMEGRATRIQICSPLAVPGLLQIPGYAEALIRETDPDAPESQLESWVDIRMTRQQIIMGHRPVEFDVILDQAVFSRVIGSADVMRRQLDHILKAYERENINLRVLPLTIGAHAGLSGCFEIYTLHHPYPAVGFADTPAGEICVEETAVERLARSYHRVQEACLDVAASRELIIAERNKL